MEYRRRKRNRRTRRSRAFGYAASGNSTSRYMGDGAYARTAESGGALGTVLLLLLVGGIVYVFAATPVGSWIVGKVFGRGSEGTPLPTLAPTVSGLPVSPEPTDGNVQSKELHFPGVDMYALQIGVYDSLDNARGLISTLHSLGAGGYGFSTDAGYHVLAACYTTEEAAESVCTRLTQQGYACLVYGIKCDGVNITVTADETGLEAVRSAVELAHGLVDDLNEEVLDFDTEQRSAQYGKAIVGEMLENIRSIKAAISDIDDAGGAVRAIGGFFDKADEACSELVSCGSDNRVEISGRMKSLQIGVIESYTVLLDGLRQLMH